MKKSLKIIIPLILGVVFGIGVRIYYREFIDWDNMPVMYVGAVLILLSFTGLCALTGKRKKGIIIGAVGGLLSSAAVLFGLTFIINNMIFMGGENVYSITLVLRILTALLTLIFVVYLIKNKFVKQTLVTPICALVAVIAVMAIGGYSDCGSYMTEVLRWEFFPPSETSYFETWSADDEYTEDYAVVIEKEPDKDFVILNFADVQLSNEDYEIGMNEESEAMIKELVEKSQPDLITLTGDNAWFTNAYIDIVKLVDSFGIPWAPVMGNHDGQGTTSEFWCAYQFSNAENCLWKFGPENMGYGNYIINIEENGEVVHTLFMMDTHSDVDYTDENGDTVDSYDHLWDNQIDWYEWAVKGIEKIEGKKIESTAFMHIPVYEVRAIYEEYYDEETASYTGIYKKNIVGVSNELPGSPLFNNNFTDKAIELGSTKNMFFGHDHANNMSIAYNGINLNYTLKLGKACYYEEGLQGGTVINISSNGECNFEHVYICTSVK